MSSLEVAKLLESLFKDNNITYTFRLPVTANANLIWNHMSYKKPTLLDTFLLKEKKTFDIKSSFAFLLSP